MKVPSRTILESDPSPRHRDHETALIWAVDAWRGTPE